MSDATKIGVILGFTPAWYALGIVDQAFLDRARTEWKKGEDDNPGHYRYWALLEFLNAHPPLSAELAMALYELGDADTDQLMGGAIMAAIVHSPECPQAVLAAASASGRRHVIKAVECRRPEAD
jgi:hypothetical protein